MIGRSVILAAVALTLSVAAAAAFADDPPAAPQKARLICRGATKSLGSHIRSSRRCRTAEQWQEEDARKGQVPLSVQVTAGQNDGLSKNAPQ